MCVISSAVLATFEISPFGSWCWSSFQLCFCLRFLSWVRQSCVADMLEGWGASSLFCPTERHRMVFLQKKFCVSPSVLGNLEVAENAAM